MRPGGGVGSNPGAGGSATPLPCRQLRCFQRGISSSQPHKYNAGRERGARKAGPRLAGRGRGGGGGGGETHAAAEGQAQAPAALSAAWTELKMGHLSVGC